MRVFVLLVEGFGAQRWLKSTSASHSSGIVDQLPYGYYRAADDDCTIEYSQDRKEWRVVRLMRLVARRLLGFDLLHAWRNRKGIFNADVVWTHTELENLATLLLFQLIPRACRPKIIAQSVWLYDRWGHFSGPNAGSIANCSRRPTCSAFCLRKTSRSRADCFQTNAWNS